MSELRYSPFDPEIVCDPYPTYARLRAEAPVFPVPGLGAHLDPMPFLGDTLNLSLFEVIGSW